MARMVTPALMLLQQVALRGEAFYAEVLEARLAKLKVRTPELESDIIRMRERFLSAGPLSWSDDGRSRGGWGLESLLRRSLSDRSVGTKVVDEENVVGVSDLLKVCAEDIEEAMFDELGSGAATGDAVMVDVVA